ncbi:RDD family protein [Rhizobium sp.]
MASALDPSVPNYADHVFEGVLTRRVAAFLIDYAIVGLLLIPAWVILFVFSILTLGLGFMLFPVSFFIVAGLYFAFTLGSEAQATPGMRVMDLVMARDDGRRMDFGTAMVHVLAFWIINSLLTPFLLLIGLFTERRRLIHDMVLGTYMVRASATGY